MTERLSPEHIEALMAGYALGDLSPEEAEEFRQLIAGNPQLETEVKHLQEVLELLPYALPEVEPPPQLRSAVLTAANNANNNSRVRQFHVPWSKIFGSVAALLALALGLDNYRLRQELQAAQTQKNVINVLQRPHTRLFSLSGTGKTQTASGSIVINLDEKTAVMAFQNLPKPAESQVYRLWAIINDQKIPCAEFRATQLGTVLEEVTLPTAACSATKSTLAITLEPTPSPPQPVGPAVMVESTL